jgi:exodeoxyribonuclease VII large subunit
MAVANFPILVITGNRHKRDESLTDLGADSCVHTQTANYRLVYSYYK